MYKLCDNCINNFAEAGYLVEAERDIPESTGKCDGCRKKRWVKAVYMMRGRRKWE